MPYFNKNEKQKEGTIALQRCTHFLKRELFVQTENIFYQL